MCHFILLAKLAGFVALVTVICWQSARHDRHVERRQFARMRRQTHKEIA